MNKNDIIFKLKEYNINLNKVWLGFSGALVLKNIITECNDIDLEVNTSEFNRLKNLYNIKDEYIKKSRLGDNTFSLDDNIDIFEKSMPIKTDNHYGIYTYKLEDIISNYKQSNREKDKEKLNIILQYLKEKIDIIEN